MLSLTINFVSVFTVFAPLKHFWIPTGEEPGKLCFEPLAPGGIVVRIPGFHPGYPGPTPGQRTKICLQNCSLLSLKIRMMSEKELKWGCPRNGSGSGLCQDRAGWQKRTGFNTTQDSEKQGQGQCMPGLGKPPLRAGTRRDPPTMGSISLSFWWRRDSRLPVNVKHGPGAKAFFFKTMLWIQAFQNVRATVPTFKCYHILSSSQDLIACRP